MDTQTLNIEQLESLAGEQQRAEKNKATVMAFQMLVGQQLQGEPQAGISDYLSDDVLWHLPDTMQDLADGAHKKGKTAVLRLFDDIVKRFYEPKTMSFEFHGLFAAQNKVHFHFTLSAQTAKGLSYTSGYQMLFHLEQDKIAEVWEYFDSAALLSLHTSNKSTYQQDVTLN